MPTLTQNYIRCPTQTVLNIPNLICIWDFQGDDYLTAKGPHPYRLHEVNGPISRSAWGSDAPNSLNLEEGQWLRIPRADCPALDLHGHTDVTLSAWIRRAKKQSPECEVIAGMWNEWERKRQYAIFVSAIEPNQQLTGHISDVGGGTGGGKICYTGAIGQTVLTYGQWFHVAMTYDHRHITAYVNGKVDDNGPKNPCAFTPPIFNGGSTGSDFTVGSVYRFNPHGAGGVMDNHFCGDITGIAVFDRALSAEEISLLAHGEAG